ncbi:uncharacterized protein DS421_18g620480 [Arachis hypogaea]|nr:uncharacterized protein DS421_18g620480 [Arachis hypogaea]
MVLKTEPDRPVQPEKPGTGHLTGPVNRLHSSLKNSIDSSPLSKTQLEEEQKRTLAEPTTTVQAPSPLFKRSLSLSLFAGVARGTHNHRISSPLFVGVAPWKLRRRPRKLCRHRRKLPRHRVEALRPSRRLLCSSALSLFAGVAVSSVVAVTPLPPRRR